MKLQYKPWRRRKYGKNVFVYSLLMLSHSQSLSFHVFIVQQGIISQTKEGEFVLIQRQKHGLNLTLCSMTFGCGNGR